MKWPCIERRWPSVHGKPCCGRGSFCLLVPVTGFHGRSSPLFFRLRSIVICMSRSSSPGLHICLYVCIIHVLYTYIKSRRKLFWVFHVSPGCLRVSVWTSLGPCEKACGSVYVLQGDSRSIKEEDRNCFTAAFGDSQTLRKLFNFPVSV